VVDLEGRKQIEAAGPVGIHPTGLELVRSGRVNRKYLMAISTSMVPTNKTQISLLVVLLILDLNLNCWLKTYLAIKINGKRVPALLDTGCV